jgi:hypothetical protein
MYIGIQPAGLDPYLVLGSPQESRHLLDRHAVPKRVAQEEQVSSQPRLLARASYF